MIKNNNGGLYLNKRMIIKNQSYLNINMLINISNATYTF